MGLGLVADITANEAVKVGLRGRHQDGEGGPVSARRANLYAVVGPHAPRLSGVVAQGVDDRCVEHLGLRGGQHRSHLEDMGDGRLLEIAHGGMEMIDRRLDLRRVAVAGRDRGGQFAIGGADFGLQRRTARGEAGFDDVKAMVKYRDKVVQRNKRIRDAMKAVDKEIDGIKDKASQKNARIAMRTYNLVMTKAPALETKILGLFVTYCRGVLGYTGLCLKNYVE